MKDEGLKLEMRVGMYVFVWYKPLHQKLGDPGKKMFLWGPLLLGISLSR